jgi:hypothetical protein
VKRLLFVAGLPTTVQGQKACPPRGITSAMRISPGDRGAQFPDFVAGTNPVVVA